MGWVSPDDPQLGWGDMSVHRESGDYITYELYEITISPVYFYSVQQSKMTQSVLWPNQ